MNVTFDRSGFISSPPGPSNRSRDEISPGCCHRTGVPCPSFLSFDLSSALTLMLSAQAIKQSASFTNLCRINIAVSSERGVTEIYSRMSYDKPHSKDSKASCDGLCG